MRNISRDSPGGVLPDYNFGANFLNRAKYVESWAECFRTGVQLAPPPPVFVRNEVQNEDMNNFHYVYILTSETNDCCHYTGLTKNLEARLKAHNNGQVKHTSKYRPWCIETAIAFRLREKAAAFEKYLKSHSGRAFASKHF